MRPLFMDFVSWVLEYVETDNVGEMEIKKKEQKDMRQVGSFFMERTVLVKWTTYTESRRLLKSQEDDDTGKSREYRKKIKCKLYFFGNVVKEIKVKIGINFQLLMNTIFFSEKSTVNLI